MDIFNIGFLNIRLLDILDVIIVAFLLYKIYELLKGGAAMSIFIGIAGIYLAGNSKVPYDRFIRICLVTSAMQFIVYMGIGMLFGSAYKQISHYLDLFAAIAIVTVLSVLVIYFIRLIVKRL